MIGKSAWNWSKSHILAVSMGLIMIGCAAERVPPPTGFLEDYSQLQAESVDDLDTIWYEKKGVVWGDYKKVLLEPIQIQVDDTLLDESVEPVDLQLMADYFHEALARELSGRYQLVDVSGDDVLHMRIALTDARPSNPYANFFSSLLFLVNWDRGSIALEADVLDSNSLERLFAVMERRKGSLFDLSSGWGRWELNKGIIDAWALDLSRFLERVSDA